MPLLAVGAVKLPQPDGPYPVSRRTFIWADETRPEDVSIPDRGPRHVGVFAFYPAARGGRPAAYYPGLGTLNDGPAVATLKAQFLGSWKDVHDGNIETNISENSPIADTKQPFPVLLFSPGLSAPTLAYSIQLSALASHGYVIFALEHPYDTALVQLPNGRSIPFADRHVSSGPPNAAFFRVDAERESVWTKDTQFVLRHIQSLNLKGGVFENRLDLSKVGIFGHSMGGRVAVQACQIMPQVSACLNQDGGLFGVDFRSGEVIPFVRVNAATNGSLLNVDVPMSLPPGAMNAEAEKSFKQWQAKKAQLLQKFLSQNSKPTYSVVIARDGFGHGSFMDVRVLNAMSEAKDPKDSLAGLSLINKLNLAFFADSLEAHPRTLQDLMRHRSSGWIVERMH